MLYCLQILASALFSSPAMVALLLIAAGAAFVMAGAAAMHCCFYRLTLHMGDEVVSERHPGSRAVEVEAPPPRAGMRFTGWYTDRACTRAAENPFRVPVRGAHLYAGWEACSEQEGDYAQTVPDEVLCKHEKYAVVPPAEGEEGQNCRTDDTDVYVRFKCSFRAKLIQADARVKQMYNGLRSELLSYIGVRERVSWEADSYFIGKELFARVKVYAKSITVHFALDASDPELFGCLYRDDGGRVRFAAVPVRCRVTDARSYKNMLAVLRLAAERKELSYSRVEEYGDIPYESRDELIEQGLIKLCAKSGGKSVSAEKLRQMIASGARVQTASAYFARQRQTAERADDESAAQ